MLYYCPEEIVFQCKTTIDCQCGGISNTLQANKEGTSKRQYENALLEKSDVRKLKNQWYRIIKQYSACFLTKETDRLPALSGLTGIFQQSELGSFAAVLWTEDLPPVVDMGGIWKSNFRQSICRAIVVVGFHQERKSSVLPPL